MITITCIQQETQKYGYGIYIIVNISAIACSGVIAFSLSTYLENTSNSNIEIKSLQVKSIVDFSAIASSGELIGCDS